MAMFKLILAVFQNLNLLKGHQRYHNVHKGCHILQNWQGDPVLLSLLYRWLATISLLKIHIFYWSKFLKIDNIVYNHIIDWFVCVKRAKWAVRIRRGIRAGSPWNTTRRRATGIWWETTRPFSSSAIPSSSPALSTLRWSRKVKIVK